MNLRFKEDIWEPFATSTPLKPVSKNIFYDDLVKEPLVKPTDTIKGLLNTNHGYFQALQNRNFDKTCGIPEIVNNNKSSYMLYISSSDDENSSPSNKGSGIKISCESSKAAKLILKKSKDNKSDLKLVDKNSFQKKLKMSTNTLTLNKKINSRKSSHTKLKKSKAINKTVKSFVSDSVLEKENLNEHESSNRKQKKGRQCIQYTSNYKKKKIIPPKELSHQVTKSFEKLYEKSVVTQNKLYEIIDNNHPNENVIFEKQKIGSETSGDNNMVSKQNSSLLKAKIIKTKTGKCRKSLSANHIIKRKRKIKDVVELSTNNTVNDCSMEKKKKNSSHQLFSESKEQELVNSFSLTALESNKNVSNSVPLNVSDCIKNSKENFMRNEKQEPEVLANKIVETERPVRIKRQPKKYWLLENLESECFKEKKTKKIKKTDKCGKVLPSPKLSMLKSEMRVQSLQDKFPVSEKNEVINNSEVVKEHKISKNTFTNASQNKKKNEERRPNLRNKISKEKKKESINNNNSIVKYNGALDTNSEKSSLKKGIKEKNEKTDSLVENKNTSKPSKTQDVFKQLNQLSFKEENQQGCSIAEVWFLKNVKCGVFKIQKNFVLTHKTKFKNSYLGGVLLKGRLNVTIGEKKSDLQEGDMIFVPPLTNWSANNSSDIESVFYYWCGRFRV